MPVQDRPDRRVAIARRLCRFDGRTRVTAVRVAEAWERLPQPLLLSEAVVRRLRKQRVEQVELRRRLRRVRVPLQWLPPRTLDRIEQLLPVRRGTRA